MAFCSRSVNFELCCGSGDALTTGVESKTTLMLAFPVGAWGNGEVTRRSMNGIAGFDARCALLTLGVISLASCAVCCASIVAPSAAIRFMDIGVPIVSGRETGRNLIHP